MYRDIGKAKTEARARREAKLKKDAERKWTPETTSEEEARRIGFGEIWNTAMEYAMTAGPDAPHADGETSPWPTSHDKGKMDAIWRRACKSAIILRRGREDRLRDEAEKHEARDRGAMEHAIILSMEYDNSDIPRAARKALEIIDVMNGRAVF